MSSQLLTMTRSELYNLVSLYVFCYCETTILGNRRGQWTSRKGSVHSIIGTNGEQVSEGGKCANAFSIRKKQTLAKNLKNYLRCIGHGRPIVSASTNPEAVLDADFSKSDETFDKISHQNYIMCFHKDWLEFLCCSFALDPQTGSITLVSSRGLDREKIAEYLLAVEARDEDGNGHKVGLRRQSAGSIRLYAINFNPTKELLVCNVEAWDWVCFARFIVAAQESRSVYWPPTDCIIRQPKLTMRGGWACF